MTLDREAPDNADGDRSMSTEGEKGQGGSPGSGDSAILGTIGADEVVVTALSVTNRRTTRDVAVLCPFCGKVHHHGWPYNSAWSDPGDRISHCVPYYTRGGRRVVPKSGAYYILAPSDYVMAPRGEE